MTNEEKDVCLEESFWLSFFCFFQALTNDEWRYVCWEEGYWADFRAREEDATKWCRKFDMTFGSPYTGTG